MFKANSTHRFSSKAPLVIDRGFTAFAEFENRKPSAMGGLVD